jgi:hypothetical protein
MFSKTNPMENNAKLLESMLVKITDYGKTSIELVKLKALDKTTDVVADCIPVSAVIIIIASCLLFINVGLAFWLGDILGKVYFGFFIVAAFYLITGSVAYILLKNWVKNAVCSYIIKQALK